MIHGVAEIGERGLIDRIRARIPPPPSWVIAGIGDDAAVVEPERNALEVITTDALVEGVHFDRSFCGPADIGHKALAVNLSDLAAMGAAPRAALLSLMLPAALPVADVDALVDGMLALAERSRIALVGGNITRSPGPLIVDVTVTGSVHRRRMLTRGGARAGDEIYVTGSIGGAAAGLHALQLAEGRNAATGGRSATAEQAGAASGRADAFLAEGILRYLRPEPRLRCGLLLGRNRAARACIDLSDGLADGVRQIAQASGVGAVIDAHSLPILSNSRQSTVDSRQAANSFEGVLESNLFAAIAGGEDYELLFTSSPKLRGRLNGVRRLVKDLPITKIGHVTADRALVLDIDGRKEELPRGWEHF
ncbi:MAG TPA: thiamine-phosphate kinase [Vicinamibacterales bacterium]|nr:thiamine-phosphate kinase [Vicinamibacterales bacterium]